MDASSAAVFDVLSAVPAAVPSVLELSRLGMTCAALSFLCKREIERRCRALLHLAWSTASPTSGYFDWRLAADEVSSAEAHSWLQHLEKRPSDFAIESDMVAVAARFAGGWSALLAGREGLLATTRQPRARAVPRGAGGAGAALLLWDLLGGGAAALWSGVFPAAPLVGNVVKFQAGGRSLHSLIYPFSARFLGEERRYGRHGSRRGRCFQRSGRTDGTDPWRFRVSVLAPGCSESHLSTLTLQPRMFILEGDGSFQPSVPEPQRIALARDEGVGEVPGVYNCWWNNFETEEDEWGSVFRWGLDLWIDSRAGLLHADASLEIEDRAWPSILAHGRRAPRLASRSTAAGAANLRVPHRSLHAAAAERRGAIRRGAGAEEAPAARRRPRSAALGGGDAAASPPASSARRVAARRSHTGGPGQLEPQP